MFANKHAKILIALVCAVLGFMLATQFKTTERQKTINIQRAEDLSDRLKAVEKERDELSKEMEKLQAKAGDEVVAREIVRLKAFAGDLEMHGKGIKLVLDDSKIASKPGENPNLYIIHDDDLLVNNYLDEIEPCLINCVDGLFVCPKTFIDGEPLPTLNNSERMEIMKITLMYQYLFPILCASGNALRKSKILEYGGYTSKTYAPDFFFSKMVYYSNVYMTNKSLIYYRKGLNESTKTEVMDKLNYINHYFRIQNFQRIGIPLYLINIIMPYSDILFEQGFKKEWNKEYQYSHMKKYKKFDVFMSGIIYRIVEMVIKVIRRVNRKIIVIE